MRVGFVICTRYKSRRVPGKALKKINGYPLLWHLIDRLLKIKKPVILAIPDNESDYYEETREYYGSEIGWYYGSEKDPLLRMASAADHHNLDHVVRVTHDKVFVDSDCFNEMFNQYMIRDLDYAYSSDLPPGTGFEIMKTSCIEQAANEYDEVEHISYAMKAITKNKMDIPLKSAPKTKARFLVDFPEDVTFMQTLFACTNNKISLLDAVDFCNRAPWVTTLNKQPLFTIYTCALNAQDTIRETISRTVNQNVFHSECEYLLIDDYSTDNTPYYMARAATEYPNIKYIRNDGNLGLASSSNIALTKARGKYIIRMDADDYFTKKSAIMDLYLEAHNRKLDAVYPGFYDGSLKIVGNPKEKHHAGGALFKTRALNHIKFTERLRNYEGYDLFLRAKTQLDIGYLKGPYFFYRHSDNSMSNTNLIEREKTKKDLEARHGV